MNELVTAAQAAADTIKAAGVLDFIVALALSVVSAVVVSLLYLVFYERRATGSQIHRSFLLMGPAVTTLFLAVQFSLPLSLGLVGALTIVRFRTPIKEPEEIGFLMLLIAASIVCATSHYLLLAIVLGAALLVLLAQKYLPRLLRSARRDGVLLVTMKHDAPAGERDGVTKLLGARLYDGRLQSISSTDGLTTVHYAFTALDEERIDELHARLRQMESVEKVSIFFNRQGALL